MSDKNSDVTAEFKHSCILITINNKYGTDYDLYDQVRHAWKVNPEKVETYPYVMAVQNGVIQEVYQDIQWKPATQENFPEFTKQKPDEDPSRYGFAGVPARLIRLDYIGKKVPSEYRSTGNPVRYVDVA